MEENKNVEPKTEVQETSNVNMVNKEEPKKKGSSRLLIILVLLFLGLFAVWFFALGGNETLGLKKSEEAPKQEETQKKEENKEQKEEEKEEQKVEPATSINSLDDVKKFMSRYELINENSSCMSNLYYLLNKSVQYIDEKDISEVILAYYRSENENVNEVSVDDYKKAGKFLFGENFEAPLLDEVFLANGCVQFKINEDKTKYTASVNEIGCGGICAPTSTHIKIDNYEKTDDTLVVSYKILFTCGSPDSFSICSDSEGKNVIGEYGKENELFSMGSTLKLTFKVGKTDYYYVGSEIVK